MSGEEFIGNWRDTDIERGRVKWFSPQRGYGFITPDDGGEDVFVHQTEIAVDGYRVLGTGNRVEYEVENTEDGRKAKKVVILSTLDEDD